MAFPAPCPPRDLLAAVGLSLAAAVATGPPAAPAQAQAQQGPPVAKPERSPEPSLAGMPLYTADGKAIGTVIAMGLDEDDKPVLVAEIAQTLGFGRTAIAVPIGMFVRKGERIELTLTEAEVNARLRQ